MREVGDRLAGRLDDVRRDFAVALDLGHHAALADGRGGIGRALLDATIAALAEDGMRALFLEVAEDNAAGRALYAAAGFSAVGRWADFYRRDGAEPASALVLRREIRPSEGA